MAGILQNVFSKGIYTLKAPENVSKIKTLVNHSALYFGLIVYTAIGAKIFQLLELPTELGRLETHQALLVTKRVLLMHALTNQTNMEKDDYEQFVDSALSSYELTCSEASSAGVDIVTKEFSYNWDYIQSVFFSLTILTTIGYGNFATETFGGRLFCLLFGIIGIPLMLSVLADVGGLMAGGLEMAWESNKERVIRMAEKMHIVKQKRAEEPEEDFPSSGGLQTSILTFVGTFGILGIFFGSGALLFTIWEDWTFFDAFYFCFITSTTIGFGDMTPDIAGKDKSLYMMVCTVYILLGLAFTSTIIEIVRRQMVENLRKMQELRAQIQAQIKLAETLKKLNDNAEKNNIDIGVNISDDLEQLRNNLNKFKRSNLGGDLADLDIEKLDWVEDNKRVKAFIIYESSV